MVSPPAPPRHLLRASLTLAFVLAASKASGLVHSTVAPFTASDLLIACHLDLAFALALTAPLGALVTALQRWPRAERWAHGLFVVLGASAAAYAVIAAHAYSFLWLPLTYRLLAVAGGVTGAWTTAREALSPGFVMALVAAVGAFLAAALTPWPRRRWTQRARTLTALGVGLVAVWVILATSLEHQRRWSGRRDRTLAESPHAAMLASLVLDRDRQYERPALGLGHDHGPTDRVDFARPFATPGPLGMRPPRRVIVYVLESTGANYLEPFGGPAGVGVRLAQLSERGLLFDRAYANLGRTEGALATLTLSTYLPMTWRQFTQDHADTPGTTLASQLAAHGFFTAFLSAAHLDYANQRRFLGPRGFERVVDGAQLGCPLVSTWGTSDACLVDALLRTVDERREQPFFVMAWTNQTHHPYPLPGQDAPELPRHGSPWELGFQRGRYLDAIREADRQLGRLVDGLRERGLLEDTLLLITGDHGESFAERSASAGHGWHLYDEAVRVPLLLHWPAGLPEAGRRSLVCSHLDLTPTLAHLLGLPQAPDWFGRSVFDPTHPGRAYLLASGDSVIVGLRDHDTKYTVNLWSGRDALFDLSADPGEQRDLASEQPARTLAPRRRLAAWADLSRSLWSDHAFPLAPPPSAQSALRELPPSAP